MPAPWLLLLLLLLTPVHLRLPALLLDPPLLLLASQPAADAAA
jgi:hypothetical protein